MSFYKKKKRNFGIYIAAGVLVFLLNVFWAVLIETEPENEKENTGHSADNEGSQPSENIDTENMQVHFLDVGQGLSVLVELGDEVLIYDGGGRDTSSFVVAYLQEQGITEIDYLISSHYDADHVSGLIGCLYAFDVKQVIGSDYVHDSKLYTSFQNAVDKESLAVGHPPVGTKYAFGEAEITILAPAEIVDDYNSNSVAIKLSYGESDFIFTGDADYYSERAMLASGIDLDCEVLSVGHHGSASSTSEHFLEATTPEYAVISCGKDNEYGHPHKEVVQLLENMQIDVFRSDVQGTVIASTDGETITWSQAPCNDYSDGN
ncbi:MAG: MBL fold metallo-hydrolase [Agathobacter sp.]|nr:MBL fold metallo-hydrolase [Agathobacter sp.]